MASRASVLELNETNGGIEVPQVVGVRGHHVLVAAPGADHDVGIRDVRRPARGEDAAHIRRIDAIECHCRPCP